MGAQPEGKEKNTSDWTEGGHPLFPGEKNIFEMMDRS